MISYRSLPQGKKLEKAKFRMHISHNTMTTHIKFSNYGIAIYTRNKLNEEETSERA